MEAEARERIAAAAAEAHARIAAAEEAAAAAEEAAVEATQLAEVGRFRLTASNPVLIAPMVSPLETII